LAGLITLVIVLWHSFEKGSIIETEGKGFKEWTSDLLRSPQHVLCVCSKLHDSKSSHLRCERFTIPQSDFRTCCFLFPWVLFPNFSICWLCGFAYYYWNLSSMVGLSNERDRKLIWLSTSARDLGKRFSKVTLCIRRHERNGEISWSLIGHQKYCLKICAQSEARMQIGSWTGLLKVSSQRLFPAVL